MQSTGCSLTSLGVLSLAFCCVFATDMRAEQNRLLVLEERDMHYEELHWSYFEKYNTNPVFSFSTNPFDAFEKMQSGQQYDLVTVCAGSLRTWIDADLIVPHVDRSEKMTGFGTSAGALFDVDPNLRQYFAPVYYGVTTPFYNVLEVPKTDVQSLDVFVNPSYSGKIALPDDFTDLISLGFLATGVKSWENPTDQQVSKTLDWLQRAHMNGAVYWADESDLAGMLRSGDVLVAWGWNTVLNEIQHNLDYVRMAPAPDEGISVWICGYARGANGVASTERVNDFLDARMSKETAETLLEWGIGPASSEYRDAFSTPSKLEKLGLAFPNAPMFVQTPMPEKLWHHMTNALHNLKNG